MQYRADIVVRAPEGRTLAVVEIKNRQGLNAQLAASFRRNMIVHGLLSTIPYFLLLSEDRGYLWHEVPDPAGLPTVEFSMSGVIARYLPSKDPTERLRGEQLELLVIQWLAELSAGTRAEAEEPESTFASVGFLSAIRGANILAEAPV